MPNGHASILPLGEGSEATEPYNKYEPLQMNQVPCILAETALILFYFENRLFCLVLKSAVLSRIPIILLDQKFNANDVYIMVFEPSALFPPPAAWEGG